MHSAIKSAFAGFLDRVLGPEEILQSLDRCVAARSVVTDSGGILLKGTKVELTGVKDRSGRWQVRVVDIPDYQWHEMSRLPYGPGFLLFVEQSCLLKEAA